jgi:GNAT superfamily N-acetyltransferase
MAPVYATVISILVSTSRRRHLKLGRRKVRPMRDEELSERPYRSLWPFCRMVAASSEGARLVELDGVIASVVPVTPDRSVTNSVAYEHVDALEQALDQLAAVYAEAGVRAWTVWVPGADRAAQRLLDRAGHRLDGTPTAMALALDDFERSPSPDIDLDRGPDSAVVGRINDVAYGFDGEFSRAFGRRPEMLRLYAARVNGDNAACVGAIHDRGDCGIFLVATRPDARGRGLAGDLMTAALNDAREAGCETASLQSTTMGKPVYARLGFREFGPLQMWERR